jgi:hypothetical protein
MQSIIIIILSVRILSVQDNRKASLTEKDIAGPLPESMRVDSLFSTFGQPKHIERTVGFCGKGPRIINNEVVEGDSIYCDSLLIYTLDSLTVCMDNLGRLEYYSFTTAILKTTRGIIGQSKEEVLQVYGKPSWMDRAYVFDEPMNGEDDTLQYVCVDSPIDIEFFFSQGRITRIFLGRGSAC